ncbi:tRNA pseudouridine(38-40) synthase TruA [Clostridium sp. B9]|uniref:tRNA pseudouridine(38-40) synthase TruA n=1 Tax=Clostridium sp. B9 TaxID=3423224 RepID=UPI003D2EF7F3
MRNIKMCLEYDGSKYKGWQKQNQKGSNVSTIQDKIEKVLSKMTGEEIQVIGCGRTDTGVHAKNYIANFKTNSFMTIDEMLDYINEYLPEDIRVKEMKDASERFHSRFNVKAKTYVYTIDNNKFKDVFLRRYAWHISEKLNLDEMRKASELLIGTHDFKSFTSLKGKGKSTIRTINSIDIEEKKGLVTLEINGNGFLLNMVRIITGTLVAVGLGELKASDVQNILEAKERAKAGEKAPAHGLCLLELNY